MGTSRFFKVVLNEKMLPGRSSEAMGNLTEPETDNNGTFQGKTRNGSYTKESIYFPFLFNILSSAPTGR